MKKDDRRFITPQEAISLLNDGDTVHTFRNLGGMLIGADWSRENIIETLKSNPDKIEIGGEGCRGMNHGLILNDNGFLFIETNEEKLNEFDPISKTQKLN